MPYGSNIFGSTPSDQAVSNQTLAMSQGLPNASTPYNRDPTRRTLTTFITNLIGYLQRDQGFQGVQFGESFENTLEECPKVVYKLRLRQAGVDGHNRKSPFQAEQIPLEDGKMLIKYIHPQYFEIGWEIYATTSDEADNLRDQFEAWCVWNADLIVFSGAECMFFSSELEPSIVDNGQSQKIYKRQIYYSGSIRYNYPMVVNRVQSVNILSISDTLQFNTAAVVRQSSTVSYDQVPIAGPLVIIAVHKVPNIVSVDYMFQMDYSIVADRMKWGNTFYIEWLGKGISPTPGSTYYITYYLPAQATVGRTTIETEANTNPGFDLLPPEQSGANRGRNVLRRPPITSRILGQEVDPLNPTRGQTIVISQGNTPELVTPGLSSTYLESIVNATTNLVAVLDPVNIPSLAQGSAFSNPSS